MTILAQDTFIRPNQSGFGTASDGINVWGSPINAAVATAAITGNEGVMTGTTGGGDSQIILGSLTPTDINMLIRTATSNTGQLNGLLWRYTSVSGGSGYRCGFFGGTTFNVDKYTTGSRANIGSFSFAYSASTFYWIRLIHTSGGTLEIRAWQDGSSEPNNFNLTQSETTYASGNFGVSTFIANPNTVSYDHLTVTDNSSVVHFNICDGLGGVFS